MTWLKIDDRFAEHPKVIGLSSNAFRLHVAAMCRCAAHLTDGRVTERDVRVLAPICGLPTWKKYVNELVSANLWLVRGHGWNIKDYLEYNPSSVKVKEQRLRNLERQNKHRRNAVTDGVTNAVTNAVSHTAPSRPVNKTEEPTTLVPRDVTSGVDAGQVIDLTSVLKDVS